MSFTPDGRHLVIGGKSIQVQTHFANVVIWDIPAGKRRLVDQAQPKITIDDVPVACSPDGRLVVGCNEPNVVKIWDITNVDAPPQVIQFNHSKGSLSEADALCFTSDSRRVLVSFGLLHLAQFDINSGDEMSLRGDSDDVRFVPNPKRFQFAPNVIGRSQNSDQYLLGATDQGVRIYNAEDHSLKQAFPMVSPWVKSEGVTPEFKQIFLTAFLKDDAFVLAVGHPAFGIHGHIWVVIHEMFGGQTDVFEINDLWDRMPSVAISEDGRTLAVKNARIEETLPFLNWQKENRRWKPEHLVSIFKIEQGKFEVLGHLNLGIEWVGNMALSPHGDTLVTSGPTLRFWDLSKFQK